MKRESYYMDRTVDFIFRWRKIIPAAALILIVLSVFAAARIQVKTEFKDLLPENNPKIESFHEVNDRFSGGEKVIVVVEGPDRPTMARAAEELSTRIQEDDDVMRYIRAVNIRADRDFIEEWGLMLQEADDIERSADLYSNYNLLPFMRSLNDSMESEYLDSDPDEKLSNNAQERETVELFGTIERFTLLLQDYLEAEENGSAEEYGHRLAEGFMYGDEYGFSWDNSMLLFTISPKVTIVDIAEGAQMMKAIKAHGAEVEREFPEVKIGYTGGVALNADEMAYMSFDMVVPALIALALILILFAFSFRRLRFIFLVAVSLAAGIILNYGLVGVTVRVITTITSFMATLLIGLGIDYGIQIIGNYDRFRSEGMDAETALRQTFHRAGMGTVFAAGTTAVAFFVMAFTGSKAFTQFGITAGMGIVACFLSMFFLLPSLILLFDTKPVKSDTRRTSKRVGGKQKKGLGFAWLPKCAAFSASHRVTVIVAALLISSALAYTGFTRISFETDLMNLEPQEMPSVITYRKLMETYDINPFTSFVVADNPAEAREYTDLLEEESLVSRVESVGEFLPSPQEQDERLREIRKIRERGIRVQELGYGPEDMEDLAYEIQRFEWNVIEIGQLSIAGLGEDNLIVKKRNMMVHEVLGAEVGKAGQEIFQKLIGRIEQDPDAAARKLSSLDPFFAERMGDIVGRMLQADRRIRAADLPDSIHAEFFDESGTKNLVTIYPVPTIMDHIERMRHFNSEMEEISPKITGSTQFMVEWINEVFRGSRNAAILIFTAVFLMRLIDVRSIRQSFAAAVPLMAAVVWMLGIYPLLGLKLNPLNIAVIPLVIGMGIDFGIHIVHRYRVEGDVAASYHYTGKAVLLSGLTTLIGFGSLALVGSFKSIASIGEVLGIGIAAALFASIVILPAFLGPGKGKRTGMDNTSISKRIQED